MPEPRIRRRERCRWNQRATKCLEYEGDYVGRDTNHDDVENDSIGDVHDCETYVDDLAKDIDATDGRYER